MRLIFLGTSCSITTPTRDANHYVVTRDDRSGGILVDVAGSTYHHLRSVGLEPSELSAVVLTHHHADHVAGLPVFAQALMLLPQSVRLPVYGPPETLTVAQRLCEVLGLETDTDALTLEWNEIDLDVPQPFILGDGFHVRAIRSAHSLPCAALRFEEVDTGATLVSSSDSYYNPELASLATGCDLLIHDCIGPAGAIEQSPPNHAEAEQVAQTTRDAKPKTLMPMHIVESNLPEVLTILEQQVPCPVLEPRDKVVIVIQQGKGAAYDEKKDGTQPLGLSSKEINAQGAP